MSFIPKAHEIYKHFKGNLYQIIAVAEHTETGEHLVVYQAMYGSFQIYARPLPMFIGKVDRQKYPEASQEYRFELQGPDSGRQAEALNKVDRNQPRADRDQPRADRDQPKADRNQPKADRDQPGDAAHTTANAAEDPEEVVLDPMVLEFLDADTYEERLNILAGIHHRVTDDMLTTMAISCDVEVPEGSLEERYDSLRNCLLTLEKYECNRLR